MRWSGGKKRQFEKYLGWEFPSRALYSIEALGPDFINFAHQEGSGFRVLGLGFRVAP